MGTGYCSHGRPRTETLYDDQVETGCVAVKAIRWIPDRLHIDRHYVEPVEVEIIKTAEGSGFRTGIWVVVDVKYLQEIGWPYHNPPQYFIHERHIHGVDVSPSPYHTIYQALPDHDHEFMSCVKDFPPAMVDMKKVYKRKDGA